MRGSHSVVTAWVEDRLVGLGNTLSDGHLVVYYPHLLVHPDSAGVGSARGDRVPAATPVRGPPLAHLGRRQAGGRVLRECGFARAGGHRRCGFMPVRTLRPVGFEKGASSIDEAIKP